MYTQRLNEVLKAVYPSTARKLGTILVEGRSVNVGDKVFNFSTITQEVFVVKVSTEKRKNFDWNTVLYRVESEVVPIIALIRTEEIRDELEGAASYTNYPFGINISVTVVLEELDGEELGSI